MSQDLGTQETTSVRADFLVELRGFELLTSAGVGARAIDGAAASGSPFSDS
jgi:hypothetical protein